MKLYVVTLNNEEVVALEDTAPVYTTFEAAQRRANYMQDLWPEESYKVWGLCEPTAD